MNRRPIVSFLCSVITIAVGVFGFAMSVPVKDGSEPPAWKLTLWFSSIGIVAIGVIGAIISLVWLIVVLARKSKSN